MAKNNTLIDSFALGGFRSFGKSVQRFEKFGKVNFFIGRNNSGKSNVLRFLHEVYPKLANSDQIRLEPLDQHLLNGAPLTVGLQCSLAQDENGDYRDFLNYVSPLIKESDINTQMPGYILLAFQEKVKLDGSHNVWFQYKTEGLKLNRDMENWEQAFNVLDDREMQGVWTRLTGTSGGGREHWFPETLRRLFPKFPEVETVMIPAIRQIGIKGSVSEGFSGEGIIERLVKLQNPDVYSQQDRKKFEQINKFLQTVTDNLNATIEIPHERDTILVHMDGKSLPLESLGTGLHEVIILAAAATILENTVICMEEPELHLNPLLQKKLTHYLAAATTNQYFISTHSAAMMDTPGAEIYHVSLFDGESKVERVTSDRERSAICEDLGYHPSDLLQANCVIWVEGPSDRIYLNYWIRSIDPDLVEGIHYSVMFYGGRLASHLSANDPDELIDDFISLRRLNRRGVVVIDSDREKKGARINATKKRLRDEFEAGPGHAWITDGREIENYIPASQIREAITQTKPSSKIASNIGKYENTLTITTRGGKRTQASKVDVARYVVENFTPDLSIHDLGSQLKKLVNFIRESNISPYVETN